MPLHVICKRKHENLKNITVDKPYKVVYSHGNIQTFIDDDGNHYSCIIGDNTDGEWIETFESDTAWSNQEGGSHYKKLAIQPMEYSMKNGLDALQHTTIKYVTRFRDKGGVEDLRKAIHCIEMLIEYES